MLYALEWQALPCDIQRDIMLIIHRSQNGSGLKLGPFGNCINRETFKLVHLVRAFSIPIHLFKKNIIYFLQSTNKIYTFVMFLLNFFE